jgi:hypothetical protein
VVFEIGAGLLDAVRSEGTDRGGHLLEGDDVVVDDVGEIEPDVVSRNNGAPFS